MKKAKGLLFGIIVLAMLFCSSRINHASAAYGFSSMSKRDFILFVMKNPSYPSNGNGYSRYFEEPGFEELHRWFVNARNEDYYNDSGLRLDASYPWELTSDAEIEYIRDMKLVNPGKAGDAYQARWDRYNRENGVYDEWDRQHEISATRKMWSQSKLTGNPNSHGILTNKKDEIYQREENGGTKSGTDIGVGSYNMDEPSGASKVIMEFLCWLIYTLAKQLDDILSTGGIALDNVIFGRVAGYGVRTSPDSEYITLFGFELSNGNPYGYIGAMLFQRIRSYIYIFMSVFCLFKMVKIAASTDYMKMKMDFSTFAQNALISFSFIVMMPYIFDIYMYIRDVLLKAITFGTLKELFNTTGFLQSFREGAQSESLNIIPNIIYLGAVILSLVVAGIYVAYAMSMMVHFVLFPFVCLRGISDRNAYKEWAAEALGLTIMPLIDGMLLLIPLTFSDMANGNIAFNILSLVSCGMLLTARKQARRTIGIKDTGLDMGAIATVMGLGAMAKGVGNAIGKVGKKIGAAKESFGQAKEDSNMSKMYDEEPEGGRIDAPEGGIGSSTGPAGRLSAPNLARHANVNNFDKGPFKDGLDNATMAKMYRQRARKNLMKGVAQSAGVAGSAIGGLRGGLGGFGAGVFLGAGAQAQLAGIGSEVGSSLGGFVAEKPTALMGAILANPNLDDKDEISFRKGKSATGKGDSATGKGDSATTGREMQPVPINVSGDDGASEDVYVDMVNAEGRRNRADVWESHHGADYRKCVAAAAANMDSASLSKNQRYNNMVSRVKVRFNEIKSEAQGAGCNPQVVMQKFNSLHREFNGEKVGFFQDAVIDIGNSVLGKDKFDMTCQTDRDLISNMVKKETGKNGSLTKGDNYMTNNFDRKFKVTWCEWEREILSAFAKQGLHYEWK